MSKKNFMKAMGTVSDSALNRYAKFERNLEKEKNNKKARLIRIAAIAACFAILIAAIPVSFMLRDGGGEPIIERDYFVMDGAAVKQQNQQTDNCSGRIKSITHDSGESRKKGSDDPYGNGQRPNVR